MSTPNLPPSTRPFYRSGHHQSFLLGLVLALLALAGTAAANETMAPRVRIVFEFSNGQADSFDAFVANVEGVQKNSGSLADITIVASSGGVELLRAGEDPLQQRLSKLADRGVDFVVCQAGLETAQMDSADLLGFARSVKSGNDEAERLEAQGWARVRDGEAYVSHL